MKKHYVIHRNNFPTRPPIVFGIVLWLLLDRLQAPGWLYGALFCLYGILLIASIVMIFKEDEKPLAGFGPKGGDA